MEVLYPWALEESVKYRHWAVSLSFVHLAGHSAENRLRCTRRLWTPALLHGTCIHTCHRALSSSNAPLPYAIKSEDGGPFPAEGEAEKGSMPYSVSGTQRRSHGSCS